jgi:hypothetical protein
VVSTVVDVVVVGTGNERTRAAEVAGPDRVNNMPPPAKVSTATRTASTRTVHGIRPPPMPVRG